jgi:glutamine synthetase
MAALSSLIEGGKSHRDAVAQLYKENRTVIFTGNGYSAEWPVEARKRGLPNLNTTPLAVATFNSDKAKKVFKQMGVFTDAECDARQEVMYENYNTSMSIEASTLVNMVETGILPACAEDLTKYSSAGSLAGDRKATYDAIVVETKKTEGALCSCAARIGQRGCVFL